ncbi:MAG: hypothetical protein HOM11_05520 [Methylococcales bacterium]|nr:hypothetical protein [Methylococcales bacterium]MBT7443479.1 hypothetical protein [Methylococcales bacterium]
MRSSIIIHADKRLLGVIEAFCRSQEYLVILFNHNADVEAHLDHLGLQYQDMNDWYSEEADQVAQSDVARIVDSNLQQFEVPDIWEEFSGIFQCDPALKGKMKDILIELLPQEIALAAAFSEVVAKTKLSVVIVLDDWPSIFQTLIRLCKQYQIPTLNIVHGVLGVEVGRKFICDFYAVWGKRDEHVFSIMGWAKPEQIVLTGNPAWDKYLELSKAPRYSLLPDDEQVVVDKSKKIALFLSSYGLDSFVVGALRERVYAFLNAVKHGDFDGMQVIIKIHPYGTLTKEWHEDVCEEVGVSDIYITDKNLEGWLNSCDFVVTPGFSSSLVEAAMMGKPSLIVTGMKRDIGAHLYDHDCIAITGRSLNKTLPSLTAMYEQGPEFQSLVEKIPNTIHRYAYATDGQSSQRAIQCVRDIAEGKLQPRDVVTTDAADVQTFEFIMPFFSGQEHLLAETIETLSMQTHSGWSLSVFTESAIPDAAFENLPMLNWVQVKAQHFDDSIQARLDASTASWIGLIRAGDQIEVQGLESISGKVADEPQLKVIFVDESNFSAEGEIVEVIEKPAFADMNLASEMRNGVFIRREFIRSMTGPLSCLLDVQSAARVIGDQLTVKEVGNVSQVIYHYALENQQGSFV